MVTYFNKKDLVEFGKYLLSEERKHRVIACTGVFQSAKAEQENINNRLKQVSHADVENFLESIKKVD